MSQKLYHFHLDDFAEFFPHGLSSATPVSAFSTFGDDYWQMYDPQNERMRAYKPSDCEIIWVERDTALSCQPLPESMVDLLRLFAFLYLKAPALVIQRSKRTGENHPHTVASMLSTLQRFFGVLCEKSVLDGGSLPPVRSFADITPRHIQETLPDVFGRSRDLKRGLIALTSHSLELACNGRTVGWTAADVENMSFNPPDPRTDYERVFPNAMFRLVSNSATDDIVGFLNFVGEKPASTVNGNIPEPFGSLLRVGPQIFQTYVELREATTAEKRGRQKAGKYGEGEHAKRDSLERFGTSAAQVLAYLNRVRDAACSLVALYTGARYTELTGFKAGCLQKISGMWFLVGTLIKQEDLKKPLDNDLWPAIPAMRDAIRCLELFRALTNNHFLVCSLDTVQSGKERAYSVNGLTEALDRYLRVADTAGAWDDIVVSPHRCRHTLAHQLARADVGLVFIAYQMKHLHSALKAVPPQVTLMYGGISDLKMERAVQATGHQYDLAKALYDPDSPIAGGGAEEFKSRRTQYFEGMMASGRSKEDIIQGLAKTGVGLSSVGMGFCSGRRDIRLKDGTTEKPPCIGSLQCSPETCHNALITKLHEPLWQKVETQNLELAAREDMRHSRDELLRRARIARGVLVELEAN